jgi:ATP-dependent Clp protease adaptor protein ClpS
MCYLFLATVQQILLDKMPPTADLLTQVGNFFRRLRGGASRGSATNGQIWGVVVRNDPVNLMAYVTSVFEYVLNLPRVDAQRHMREVHELKRSVVWKGPREKAEAHVNRLRAWHLTAELEPNGP